MENPTMSGSVLVSARALGVVLPMPASLIGVVSQAEVIGSVIDDDTICAGVVLGKVEFVGSVVSSARMTGSVVPSPQLDGEIDECPIDVG